LVVHRTKIAKLEDDVVAGGFLVEHQLQEAPIHDLHLLLV
jgi:hypothetical protein